MKLVLRTIIALMLVCMLSVAVYGLWRAITHTAEPGESLEGVGAGPSRAVEPRRGAMGIAGTPIPSAEVVPANASDERCVEGRVIDVVTGRGIADATLEFWPRLTATTDAEGRFGARALWNALTLKRVNAEGYFSFGDGWNGIEMTLTKGTCAAGLVIPLVPRVKRAGRVVDVEGQPLADVQVTISNDGEAGTVLRSDARGAFSFFARDGALIEARLAGFVPTVRALDFAASVSGELVLTLERTPDGGTSGSTSISVRVEVSETGGEIAGAEVIAWRDTKSGPLEVARTRSNGAPSFAIDVPQPGPWLFEARAYSTRSSVVMTEGEAVVLKISNFRGVFRGRVRDESGKPVTAFSVLLRERRGPLAEGEASSHHIVSSTGEFKLAHLPLGDFNVSITALGYAPTDSQRALIEETVEAETNFTLDRGGAVSGRVIDRRSRQPLGGALVSLEGQGDLFGAASTRSDADGGFVLEGLRPGRRSLFIVADAHHARLLSVEAESRRTVGPLEVSLTPLAQGEAPRIELVGIGAVLQAKGDALVVMNVIAGGGASEVGLVSGDALISIEGQLAGNLGFAGAVELIRGAEGTSVVVSVRRADGSLVDLRVPRRVILPP